MHREGTLQIEPVTTWVSQRGLRGRATRRPAAAPTPSSGREVTQRSYEDSPSSTGPTCPSCRLRRSSPASRSCSTRRSSSSARWCSGRSSCAIAALGLALVRRRLLLFGRRSHARARLRRRDRRDRARRARGRALGWVTLEDVTGPGRDRPSSTRRTSGRSSSRSSPRPPGVLSLTSAQVGGLSGVFISVTTVPAAGNVALGLAFGVPGEVRGSLAQLGLNIIGMAAAGWATLALQQSVWNRMSGPELPPEPGRNILRGAVLPGRTKDTSGQGADGENVPHGLRIELAEVPRSPWPSCARTSTSARSPAFLGGAFEEVVAVLGQQGLRPPGPPLGRFVPVAAGGFRVEAGFPVARAVSPGRPGRPRGAPRRHRCPVPPSGAVRGGGRGLHGRHRLGRGPRPDRFRSRGSATSTSPTCRSRGPRCSSRAPRPSRRADEGPRSHPPGEQASGRDRAPGRGSGQVVARAPAPHRRRQHMTASTTRATALALVAPGRGILAADESAPTMARRLAGVGLESTEPVRRSYREALFTTAGPRPAISGVILYDETIRQRAADGTPVARVLDRAGSSRASRSTPGVTAAAVSSRARCDGPVSTGSANGSPSTPRSGLVSPSGGP